MIETGPVSSRYVTLQPWLNRWSDLKFKNVQSNVIVSFEQVLRLALGFGLGLVLGLNTEISMELKVK